MLPPIVKAMRDQRKYTIGKSEYVFLNQYGSPVLPDSMSQHIWKTTLEKANPFLYFVFASRLSSVLASQLD